MYTSAITKAGSDEAASRLGDAFVAAHAQLQSTPEGAEQLLGVLLEALGYAITFSGCEAPREFATGAHHSAGEGAGHQPASCAQALPQAAAHVGSRPHAAASHGPPQRTHAGLFERLAQLDPSSKGQLRTAFNQLPAVQACGYV